MTIDKAKLKALAENTKGWDKLNECWPAGESDPDWEVGAVQDGERYPVLTVNTDQYDAEHDAVKLAQYYAAANPKAILALIAEIDELRKDAERLSWLDESKEVDSVGPTLCCGKHRPTLREAIDIAMSLEQRLQG